MDLNHASLDNNWVPPPHTMHVHLVHLVIVLLPLTHMYITAAAAAVVVVVVLQLQHCCLNVFVLLEIQTKWPPSRYKQHCKHTAMCDLDHTTSLAICLPQCMFTFLLLFSRLCTFMLPLLCYNSNSDCLIVLFVLEMQTKWPPSRY